MPEPANIPELTDHLGYWMRVVSNAVSFSFARKLETKGITTAEWVVMRVLHDLESAPPSRVAGRMGMTRGAVSRLTDRLVGKGMVSRKDDPADGRAHNLSLTPAGRRLLPELAALAERNEAEFFGTFTRREKSQIEAFFKRVIKERGIDGTATD
ncbi:MarR family transcriptional regulator [Luteolibacter yonseiensis]|uniref:MarR family transcriptional regulator n=1 Tax=Luteolibacter yonseiensis TaxID=1144680 RepID=A0A934R832_9BACT|nr:MarR family transcriptional regulator [Luteolibacter yonseiensis]MBK1818027.1 MarR family transcriptional regulator [Luteolibacter yonseiensis]